jgi:hypothetical protein
MLTTTRNTPSFNELVASPSSDSSTSSLPSAHSPISPLHSMSPKPGGQLRSIDNSISKQTSLSADSISDLLPISQISILSKATSIFFWVLLAPSICVPLLLNNIRLQNPDGIYGYAENWVWAGIFMPLTTFMVAIFPTFIVSTIMGSIKSTAQLLAWRISSVTFACGAAISAYAVLAELIYPRFTKSHLTFPVPWTPIWIPPLSTAVASFTARLIRLVFRFFIASFNLL